MTRFANEEKADSGFSWGEESEEEGEILGSIGFEISLRYQQPQQLNSFLKNVQFGRYFVDVKTIKSSRDNTGFKASIFGSIFYKKI